eukprot:5519373-Amphidinium_carterae.2
MQCNCLNVDVHMDGSLAHCCTPTQALAVELFGKRLVQIIEAAPRFAVLHFDHAFKRSSSDASVQLTRHGWAEPTLHYGPPSG